MEQVLHHTAADEAVIHEVDEALAQDRELARRRTEEAEHQGAKLAVRGARLSGLLRGLGSLVLLTAAGTFLVQQWGEMNHLLRYGSFLLFTLGLTAAGFFCGIRVREDKGARTFLAIAAAIIPVHFAQLGALIYSKFITAAELQHFPRYLLWNAPSLADAVGTAAVGFAALIPVALLSFMTLARVEARRLSVLYMTLGALLLVPTRDPNVVALIGGAMMVLILVGEKRFSRVPALKTFEGGLARGMQAIPVAMLIGRSLHLYQGSAFFVGMLFAMAAAVLFYLIPANVKEESAARLSQAISIVPTCLSWIVIGAKLCGELSVAQQAVIPILALPVGGILLALSLIARDGGALHRKVGAIIAMGSVILELFVYPGIGSALLCIFAGLGTAVYGFTSEQKLFFVSGIVTLVFGLLYHLRFAVDLYSYSPWITLAVLGTVTVLASSYVERNFAALLGKVMEMKGRLRW